MSILTRFIGRACFSVTLYLLLIFTLSANPDLAQWQTVTANSTTTALKGPFEQQKTTQHLRRPIKSSGTLLLSPNQGVIWHTQQPIDNTMVIVKDHIITIDSQGQHKKISGGSDLNLMFANALTGNWALLKNHFSLNNIKRDDRYCVQMTPQTELSRQTIAQMAVCGNEQQITQLSINEVNGGKIDIQLKLKPYLNLSAPEQLLLNHE